MWVEVVRADATPTAFSIQHLSPSRCRFLFSSAKAAAAAVVLVTEEEEEEEAIRPDKFSGVYMYMYI